MFRKKDKELDRIFSDHSSMLEKRREIYMENQQQSRGLILARSRNLEAFLNDFDEDISQVSIDILGDLNGTEAKEKTLEKEIKLLNLMEEEEKGEKGKEKEIDRKVRKKLRQYAKIYSVPEHMFALPRDLRSEEWIIVPRPEGITCLIISRKGTTYIIDRNGIVVRAFTTEFPGGNPKSKWGSSIMEGVFAKSQGVCYLSDVLFWNGQNLMECSCEMRIFWLSSHVQTLKSPQSPEIRFQNLPFFPCDSHGFNSAYQQNLGFLKNGLFFKSKKGPYIPGVNPYFLLWKDSGCCQSLYQNSMSETFPGYLKLNKSGSLITLDGVTLRRLSPEEMGQYDVRKGDLVKVEINEDDFSGVKIEEIAENNSLILANLKVVGSARVKRRALPDTLSKLLFIHHIKSKPLTMSQIDGYLKLID